jgi:hypothetical protein
MNYTLLIYESPGDFALRTDPQRQQAYWGAWSRYAQALREAGILVSRAGLQLPETATTLKLRDGERFVQDGPFADTKEQIGGFFIIDAPNLDVALDWSARCPIGPGGTVEIRPALLPSG